MIYVALLRGINVGGNNKISMQELKTTFEDAGMTSVVTYINSGNVVFSDSVYKQSELASLLEEGILKDFGLAIKVLVRSLDEIAEVMGALPDHWQNNKEMKSDVMFLWEEVANATVLDQVTIKAGIDNVIYLTGTILWSVDKVNQSKSGMSRLASSKLYKKMTIRNVNSLRKIYAIMQDIQE